MSIPSRRGTLYKSHGNLPVAPLAAALRVIDCLKQSLFFVLFVISEGRYEFGFTGDQSACVRALQGTARRKF